MCAHHKIKYLRRISANRKSSCPHYVRNPIERRICAFPSRFVACSKLQTDFSEMMAAGFMSECVSDLIEAEAAIDGGLNVGRLNCSNKLRLMLAAGYYQALKPSLSGHQVCGRDLTGSAS